MKNECLDKVQCPSCKEQGMDNSGDNLGIYEDGTGYCFNEQKFFNKEQLEGMMENTKLKVVQNKEYEAMIENTEAIDLPNRGLTKKSCEIMGYHVGRYSGYVGYGKNKRKCNNELVHVANYYDEFGNVIKQKIRTKNKEFKWLGDTSKAGLFGMSAWKPKDNLFICVTEGELDAVSVVEACGNFPVVSIANGSGSAKKELAENVEYLDKFKHVVLCLDQDEPGRKAAKECTESGIRVGGLYNAKLPLKDPNEMLVQGRAKELKNALFNAGEVRPDSIKSITEIREKLKPVEMGISWPWPYLTQLTYGIRTKQIYTFGAGSGIGKTEVLGQVQTHLVKNGEKIGIISFEQTPQENLIRLLGSYTGQRLHVPGAELDMDELNPIMDTLSEKVYWYDHFGSCDLENTLSKIRYMVKGLGIKYIFLDHLTALAAGMKDERKGLDEAMAEIGGIVQELDFTLFLVSHLSKPSEGKSYEEGRKVTPHAFRGSNAIQYWSTFMFGLERNKLSDDPDERLITTFRIIKDRQTGDSDGSATALKYNRLNGRLEEII